MKTVLFDSQLNQSLSQDQKQRNRSLLVIKQQEKSFRDPNQSFQEQPRSYQFDSGRNLLN